MLVKTFGQNNGTVQKVHDGTTVLNLEITRNNLQKVFLSLESVFGDQFRTNENFLYQTAHADFTNIISNPDPNHGDLVHCIIALLVFEVVEYLYSVQELRTSVLEPENTPSSKSTDRHHPCTNFAQYLSGVFTYTWRRGQGGEL